MGVFDLEAAFASDRQLVQGRVRATLRQALTPMNRQTVHTALKVDFANGPLLVGSDPRYLYRSPEVTIDAIPLFLNECGEESTASWSGYDTATRQAAGVDSSESTPLTLHHASLAAHPDVLPPGAGGWQHDAPFLRGSLWQLPSARPRAVFHELVAVKGSAVLHHKQPPPPEHDVRYLSVMDINKWIEEGEQSLAASSSPSSSVVSVVQQSVAVGTDEGVFVPSAGSLTPFPDGPVGSVEEELPCRGRVGKRVQAGHSFFQK